MPSNIVDEIASIVVRRFPKNEARIEKPKMKEIRADLKFFLANYEKASLKIEDVVLGRKKIWAKFVSPSIELENIKLGKFESSIDLLVGKGYLRSNLTITALKPNPAKVNGYVHPNISYNRLCLGDGEVLFNVITKQGFFSESAEIINTVLQSDSTNPYLSIKNWNGYKCNNCASIKLVRIIDCGCKMDACNECAKSCDCCKMLVHRECKKKCDVCKSNYCGKCSVFIDKIEYHTCQTSHCYNCMSYKLISDFSGYQQSRIYRKCLKCEGKK